MHEAHAQNIGVFDQRRHDDTLTVGTCRRLSIDEDNASFLCGAGDERRPVESPVRSLRALSRRHDGGSTCVQQQRRYRCCCASVRRFFLDKLVTVL